MFVDKSMIKKVVTIGRDTGIIEIKSLMKEYGIRHLPVVDKNSNLIGIVTDRDIRSAMPSILLDDFDSAEVRGKLAGLTAKDIMTKEPTTVSPTYTLQDVLLLMQDKKVGAFPVVDKDGKLKGIISIRDLMRAFINVLGIGEPGTLLGILAEQKVGEMKKIVDAVTEENISFGSILVARYWDDSKRALFIYLLTNNVGKIKRKLTGMGYKLIDPMEWYIDQLPKNE
ncbi:CBS domain-containing protein [Desulfonema limicola]|uniref:CBS domain-containing protein n=1 Tax=Desulfonema limicola TaxID=45656 RepID=A0A975GFS7_9BACT|nr:CBS domain-containing protein [Desulfonema limicola]QTA79558.1 CBS domain-containing protein [Desulfonema limicola]